MQNLNQESYLLQKIPVELNCGMSIFSLNTLTSTQVYNNIQAYIFLCALYFCIYLLKNRVLLILFISHKQYSGQYYCSLQFCTLIVILKHGFNLNTIDHQIGNEWFPYFHCIMVNHQEVTEQVSFTFTCFCKKYYGEKMIVNNNCVCVIQSLFQLLSQLPRFFQNSFRVLLLLDMDKYGKYMMFM